MSDPTYDLLIAGLSFFTSKKHRVKQCHHVSYCLREGIEDSRLREEPDAPKLPAESFSVRLASRAHTSTSLPSVGSVACLILPQGNLVSGCFVPCGHHFNFLSQSSLDRFRGNIKCLRADFCLFTYHLRKDSWLIKILKVVVCQSLALVI